MLFDFINGRAQSLFLLRREIGNVAFGVGVEEVDEPRLQQQQVDHPRPSALAPAFGRPAHFAQAAETGNDVTSIGPRDEEMLEARILGVRPQVCALLGEGWRLNEGQHALLLCNTFLVWCNGKSDPGRGWGSGELRMAGGDWRAFLTTDCTDGTDGEWECWC